MGLLTVADAPLAVAESKYVPSSFMLRPGKLATPPLAVWVAVPPSAAPATLPELTRVMLTLLWKLPSVAPPAVRP